ncbi:MAG: hypothetical protein LBE57_01780 [Methanosarcinales archaeon]|nr:hypothetical protein [Methanosarcinales archaeon]
MSDLINQSIKSENRRLNILKSFITVIVYFVAVFYTCYFISFVFISLSMAIYTFSNPEMFIQIAGAFIFIAIGGIEFYRAFRGQWTLTSFILSIPLLAILLLKAIIQKTTEINFEVKPFRIDSFVKEILKLKTQ